MIAIAGHGLHGGAPSTVRLVRAAGAVRLRAGGAEARIAELVFDGSARSTVATTRDRRLRVATVEHLFAALGALSIRDGVVVEIDGPEVPLIDGGAAAFVDALVSLGPSSSPPILHVVREGTIELGASRYELRPPRHPTEVHVQIEVDFDDARLARHASWNGDPHDFRARIAPARTFGFEHEVEELLARGLASHVLPESVVVVARDRVLSAGPAFQPDEPARHKLLDLIGDLYGHGGPPVGSIRAVRPGHAATHEAIRRGLAEGLLLATRTR